eukprot:TRINITY_DN11120_c2_g1_i6.p1 TRINITY_DN11120_c2_g1~~TRINITY_DN11120_c2_g1_i6.p1  ORF type:complete len:158 (-),score=6.70 TRINITY_DN11120_c2_g1_i6:82-555(-)
MLWLGWQFRRTCLAVLILNLLLVALNLSGLQLAGLGIDVLRRALQPGSPVPQWPFGWTPPSSWSTMTSITVVAALVLTVALVQAALKFVTAVVGAALSQQIVIQLRTDVYDKLQRLSFQQKDEKKKKRKKEKKKKKKKKKRKKEKKKEKKKRKKKRK